MTSLFVKTVDASYDQFIANSSDIGNEIVALRNSLCGFFQGPLYTEHKVLFSDETTSESSKMNPSELTEKDIALYAKAMEKSPTEIRKSQNLFHSKMFEREETDFIRKKDITKPVKNCTFKSRSHIMRISKFRKTETEYEL